MNINKQFNLVTDPWVPVTDHGMVSLMQIFGDHGLAYPALGGSPIQKVAVTKLLLAIAQSACTPKDEEEWEALGQQGMSKKCMEYLEKWHDRFYLYGDQPFLQVPAIEKSSKKGFVNFIPEVASGNSTVLTQSQIERSLDDAAKALLLVQTIGFGFGGKADNSVVLSQGYTGKLNKEGRVSVNRPGAFLGFKGYLHSFFQGKSLQETIWVNLLTEDEIFGLGVYPEGLGVAPWERMPEGEDDRVARSLKNSLMGRLVPLSFFCLLKEDGMHCSEGVAHPEPKDGGLDPSLSIIYPSESSSKKGSKNKVSEKKKEPEVVWVNPEERPWRLLTALLSHFNRDGSRHKCYQLRFATERAKEAGLDIGVWSGGLLVGNNSGKQYVSGSGDFVESVVFIPKEGFGESWYLKLCIEMKGLEKLSEMVFACVRGYYAELGGGRKKGSLSANKASQAKNLFWQLCEKEFQNLIVACEVEDDPDALIAMRKVFSKVVKKVYGTYCGMGTARQIDAWVKNTPSLHKYLGISGNKKLAKSQEEK